MADVKNNITIPDEIKRDWRLPVYLLVVGILLFVSLLLGFFPFFQVYDPWLPATVDVPGFIAYFGGVYGDIYYPIFFGILSQVAVLVAALCSLAFSLLLKLRRTDGRRRFSLIVISLSANLLAIILLFLSLGQFAEVNQLALLGLAARYHVGLVLQAMALLTAGYIQWFFFIKIRHYIK